MGVLHQVRLNLYTFFSEAPQPDCFLVSSPGDAIKLCWGIFAVGAHTGSGASDPSPGSSPGGRPSVSVNPEPKGQSGPHHASPARLNSMQTKKKTFFAAW